MANETATTPNTIWLNGYRYKTRDLISPLLLNQFPGKVILGDSSFDNQQFLSSWIVSDQRGGLLIEEMDETVHSNRYWWADINTRFKGHSVLGDLATEVAYTSAVATAPTIINADCELTTGWTGGSRSVTQVHGGTYSWDMAGNAVTQSLARNMPGAQITASCWFYSAGASETLRIGINDGVSTTYSSTTTASSWVQKSVTKTMSTAATEMTIKMDISGGGSHGYFDDVTISATTPVTVTGTPSKWANFNNQTYVAIGAYIIRVNDTADGWVFVGKMGGTILDMIAGVNSCLYVAVTGTNYQYMSTAELFTPTNVTEAIKWVNWNDLLGYVTSANVAKFTATPNAASPSYTTKGTLDSVMAGSIVRLTTSRDADQVVQVYASTSSGSVWVHDYDNARWLKTRLKVGPSTNAGKGLIDWRDSLYIASGLDVLKYVATSTSTITNMGLSKDDELPTSYIGDIVDFVEGYNDFFAMVDASQVTGTGYSTVMGYDEQGWYTKWVDGTADQAMCGGIVSSKVSNNLWFAVGSAIYKIPLEATVRNPLKVSSKTYKATGIHISPWFDAGTSVYPKLALRVMNFANYLSATSTIQLSYRIDHSSVNIGSVGSEWTSLGTLSSASSGISSGRGVVEYSFGSSAGVVFKNIQFRRDYSRNVASTTETPDLSAFVFNYMKVLDPKWGWSFTLICDDDDMNTAMEKQANLETVARNQTLVPFIFRNDATNETHYVKVNTLHAMSQTGEDYKATYSISVIEPIAS